MCLNKLTQQENQQVSVFEAGLQHRPDKLAEIKKRAAFSGQLVLCGADQAAGYLFMAILFSALTDGFGMDAHQYYARTYHFLYHRIKVTKGNSLTLAGYFTEFFHD